MTTVEPTVHEGQVIWHAALAIEHIDNLRRKLLAAQFDAVPVDEVVHILVGFHHGLQVEAGLLLADMPQLVEDGLFHEEGVAAFPGERVAVGDGETHHLLQFVRRVAE